MLNNALTACPDHQWRDNIWDDPTDASEYSEFWFIIYHTLFWLDLYLSCSSRENFTPPSPFIAGALPEQPYTKKELQTYLNYCRHKCQTILEVMTDEKAKQRCQFPWGEEVSFAELQLYNMRHVQEHAAQLSLHLGGKEGDELDWVARATPLSD